MNQTLLGNGYEGLMKTKIAFGILSWPNMVRLGMDGILKIQITAPEASRGVWCK